MPYNEKGSMAPSPITRARALGQENISQRLYGSSPTGAEPFTGPTMEQGFPASAGPEISDPRMRDTGTGPGMGPGTGMGTPDLAAELGYDGSVRRIGESTIQFSPTGDPYIYAIDLADPDNPAISVVDGPTGAVSQVRPESVSGQAILAEFAKLLPSSRPSVDEVGMPPQGLVEPGLESASAVPGVATPMSVADAPVPAMQRTWGKQLATGGGSQY